MKLYKDRSRNPDRGARRAALQKGYSSEPAPSVSETVDYYSETEFGQLVQDKPVKDVMSVMDELISVISAIQPRLYNGVMRKLNEI